MNEELESCDFENSIYNDPCEEEVDKLNDVTFGDEIAWNDDNFNFENDDSNFERFPFDANDNESKLLSKDSNENDIDDLLGLKGSFFDYGLFKSSHKIDNNNKDEEFEIALKKLDSLVIDDDVRSHTQSSDFGDFAVSQLTELNIYAENLQLQFQDWQRSSVNCQFLSAVVAKHLTLLSQKLAQLSLPMDVLGQLRHFRVLTAFVNIDKHLRDLRAKCGDDVRTFNVEMALLAHQFAARSAQEQVEMASVHPWYGGLYAHMSAHAQAQSRVNAQMRTQARSKALQEGGWMLDTERDWLCKVQTRNLVTDNPYVHDYYYTVMTLRRMRASRDSQLAAIAAMAPLTYAHTLDPDPITMLPSPITADQVASGIDPTKHGLSPQYMPAQFANSLGLVTSSNLNTPRQTIQVPSMRERRQQRELIASDSHKKLQPFLTSDPYLYVREWRDLLAHIERVYSVILRVDEVDKSLAKMLVEQHHNRGVLLRYREHIFDTVVYSLITATDQDDRRHCATLARFLAVSKGARIVVAVLSAVSSPQFVRLLVAIFANCISLWQADCFMVVESELQGIIVSRIRSLATDELSLITAALFADELESLSLSDVCGHRCGLFVVLTVLDTVHTVSGCAGGCADQANIPLWLATTLKSTDSNKIIPQTLLQEFPVLFSISIVDDN